MKKGKYIKKYSTQIILSNGQSFNIPYILKISKNELKLRENPLKKNFKKKTIF